MQFVVGFASHEHSREEVLLGEAVTKKDKISGKRREYLPSHPLPPPKLLTLKLQAVSVVIRAEHEELVPSCWGQETCDNTYIFKPKGARCRLQVAPVSHRSNEWLGNSQEYSTVNKREKKKDISLAKQEWFSIDPRFIVNECLDRLSSTLNAFFIVPVLNFALVTLEAFCLGNRNMYFTCSTSLFLR